MLSANIEVVLFFFNDTATTEIYTLSLHDALPIFDGPAEGEHPRRDVRQRRLDVRLVVRGHATAAGTEPGDRKSTRLNSSHANISYAVFCLKKNIPLSTETLT